MADEKRKEEEEKRGHGGADNRIAYGLLMGAGVNVNGMSPSEAWRLVSQLNLLESKDWKRTEEDKADIKRKNEELKGKGENIESIKTKAKQYAFGISFEGVGNLAALNDAVDTINDIIKEYGLKKLHLEKTKDLANGVMASANAQIVNIGKRIIRNPNAAYRLCVEDYANNSTNKISEYERLYNESSGSEKEKYKQALEQAKEKSKFSRHNAIYKGEEVKSVITHEMGHVIAGQTFGFVDGLTYRARNEKQQKLVDCFNESKANGDIYKISAYGASDPNEFFAECFAVLKMGKEKLPNNIEKKIKELLK